MSVRYLVFEIQIAGVSIEDAGDVETLRQAVQTAARSVDLPSLQGDNVDISVHLAECAGKPSIGELLP